MNALLFAQIDKTKKSDYFLKKIEQFCSKNLSKSHIEGITTKRVCLMEIFSTIQYSKLERFILKRLFTLETTKSMNLNSVKLIP